METTNFFQVEKPSAYLKVGIRNNKVVAVDWAELKDFQCGCKACQESRDKLIIAYLEQAIQMLTKKDEANNEAVHELKRDSESCEYSVPD